MASTQCLDSTFHFSKCFANTGLQKTLKRVVSSHFADEEAEMSRPLTVLKWCRPLQSQARNTAALILNIRDVKKELKPPKFLGDLPEAGENCQCQSQHYAFASHEALTALGLRWHITLFLCPWKEEKCLEQSGRLHRIPLFFNKQSNAELGSQASDQSVTRAEGGHWPWVELCVPGNGNTGK